MTESAQENTQPIFTMDKFYVKDLSLEIPHAPQIFLQMDNPQIDIELHTASAAIAEGVYEVNVNTTVTAKVAEKIMFLIEAKQAGIFSIRNLAAPELEAVLAVMCPNILFPYLREVISDVSVRAGFPPIFLNPVNFDVLYQQKKQVDADNAKAS